MSNFEFLKNEYPELAELGAIAEELIDTDAASCLTKLRLIAEYIAKDIYFRYFQEKSYEKQIDLLKELEPYIDYKYMEHYISELEAYLKINGFDDYELTQEESSAIENLKNKKVQFDEFNITGQDGIFNVKNTHSILQE